MYVSIFVQSFLIVACFVLDVNRIFYFFLSDASGIDFRAMLKKKQHAKQNEEPENEMPELRHVEEPVVELKKVEKVGADVGG